MTTEAQAATAEGESMPDTAQFSLLEAALGRPFSVFDAGEEFEGEPFSATLSPSRQAGALNRSPLHRQLDRLQSTVSRVRFTQLSSDIKAFSAPEGEVEDEYDGAEAAKWLNDNIFTDANHAGDGVYNVPATLTCMQTEYDDAGNEIGEALDEECAESWNTLEVRIRVSEDDDLLRFALQLGSNHDEPVSFALGKKLVSVTLDLDEAEDAARNLAAKLGEDVPTFAMSGAVTAKLEIQGAKKARVGLSIDRAVSVKFSEEGESFEFSSAKADLLGFTLDGNAKSMEASVGLGETKVHAVDAEGTFDADLPGLTGTATFTAGQALKVSNISLGSRTTTVKIDGATALAVDLNPDNGRKFDATLAGDLLQVTPRVDFRSQTNHVALGDEPPVYDVTRILIDGGLRGRTDGALEVVGGSFGMETNPATYGFAATSGQCVRETEAIDAATDRFYTQYVVGACN